MKIIKSLVILVAAIFLGYFVYFKVYKTEEARKVEERQARKLVQFDLDHINKFTLVRPDSSIVFERGIGRIWNITSPVDTEADKEPVYILFSSLNNSDILYTIAENADDLHPFGLSDPAYYLAMDYTTGEAETLFVGNNTPDGTMTYVKYGSDDRILAVTTELTDQLRLPVNSYRSRTALNVLNSDIKSIEIERPNPDGGDPETLVLAYTQGVWQMLQPWNHLGDQKNIEEFIQTLIDAKRSVLIDEHPQDLDQYGLSNPPIIINLSLNFGMPNKVLLIGDQTFTDGRGRAYYGKQLSEDLVFATVTTGLVRLLERPTNWFIDKQPLKFSRHIIDRIVMSANNQEIVFTRDSADNWNVISPVDTNVPELTINNIYAMSRFILINGLYKYDPTEEDIAQTGLDNPRITFEFYSKNRLINSIFFGDSFTTDRQNTYFRTDISPIIYTTGSSIDAYINNILQSVFDS